MSLGAVDTSGDGRSSPERLLLAPEGWGGLGAGSVGRVTAQPAWHRLPYLHFRDSWKTSVIFFT